MFGGFSRRAFLSGAVSAFATVAVAGAPATSLRPLARPDDLLGGAAPQLAGAIAPTAEELIARARLGGHVAFAVADARTGVLLEGREADYPLPPASVAKTVTAAYALETLGADYRFRTQFVATGPIRDGIVEGDLVLAGTGDPSFDTDALAALVERLKAAGVRGVRGGFKVYSGALPYVRGIDPAQPDHVGYNPAVSGININYNRVHFEWTQANDGWAVAMDARSKTLRPAVSLVTMAVVERDLPVYTYRATGDEDHWTVASKALGHGGSRWLPVRRPDLYAGEVAQVLARAHGIKLPKAQAVATRPTGTAVAVQESADLATIVRLMLKYSTNLTAEVIGLTASQKRGLAPGDLRSSAKAMSDWAQATFGARDMHFVDHSGLGGASRITARDMVQFLVKAGYGGSLHRLMKDIAPRGADGKVLQGAPYSIQAKTGTLNFVSSLAGYVSAADKTPLVFAIFTGDPARRADIARANMERPEGGKAWTRRARWLQHQLLRRWAGLYGV